jgi:hypothetical protein
MAPPGAVTPDQQTVVLVNTFCAQTVEMLNAVSATCERKLAESSKRIRAVESKLAVLEAKLGASRGRTTRGTRRRRRRLPRARRPA